MASYSQPWKNRVLWVAALSLTRIDSPQRGPCSERAPFPPASGGDPAPGRWALAVSWEVLLAMGEQSLMGCAQSPKAVRMASLLQR